MPPTLNPGHKLGKYRIQKRLSEGGFARVYKAIDTIEGVPVALKVPHAHLLTKDAMQTFRAEARLHGKLDHPNILPIKTAELIDEQLVIVYPLGQKTLGDRLRNRMTMTRLLDYAEQMLEAVAHAHQKNIVHCDLKPENMILFPGDRLRLADFGISRFAHRTLRVSGSGTIGYIAPEQAMGKASIRSDVFSLGLILWQMLTGKLPEWPFDWPFAGYEKLRGRLHPDFVAFLRRALEVAPKKRFADAGQMLAAFRRLKPRVRRFLLKERRRRNGSATTGLRTHWKAVRFRECERRYKGALRLDRHCVRCRGPMAEAMTSCPWCGQAPNVARHDTDFPARCPRCHRGHKRDWRFCAWCHGPGFDDVAERSYPDRRYSASCQDCRGDLMPFMRYCPWCRKKVRRAWRIPDSKEHCSRCGWGVLRDFWSFCPWCDCRLAER
jgi:serine/threonine-protein kinase